MLELANKVDQVPEPLVVSLHPDVVAEVPLPEDYQDDPHLRRREPRDPPVPHQPLSIATTHQECPQVQVYTSVNVK